MMLPSFKEWNEEVPASKASSMFSSILLRLYQIKSFQKKAPLFSTALLKGNIPFLWFKHRQPAAAAAAAALGRLSLHRQSLDSSL